MNILLLLIPMSLLLLAAAVWAFVWAVKRGQFDDLDTPALDILRDDPRDLQLPQAPPAGIAAPDIENSRAAAPADADADADVVPRDRAD